MKNFKYKNIFLILLISFSGNCFAGYKRLSVAFFDYSGGLGKKSFESLRKSEYEDACWNNSFGEIRGIETAYINNIPKILKSEQVTSAIENKPNAIEILEIFRIFGTPHAV